MFLKNPTAATQSDYFLFWWNKDLGAAFSPTNVPFQLNSNAFFSPFAFELWFSKEANPEANRETEASSHNSRHYRLLFDLSSTVESEESTGRNQWIQKGFILPVRNQQSRGKIG